jgi:hypothetical protein
MSMITTVESYDGGVVYYVKHCPKCGGELGIEDKCIDCLYSEDTALTPDEVREYTMAGD